MANFEPKKLRRKVPELNFQWTARSGNVVPRQSSKAV